MDQLSVFAEAVRAKDCQKNYWNTRRIYSTPTESDHLIKKVYTRNTMIASSVSKGNQNVGRYAGLLQVS
jgi:hypothetical protein